MARAYLRTAGPQDAEQIAAIYRPFVAETAVSFETEPPDAAEIARRIGETLKRWPWIVCEAESGVLGYAYAGPHRTRAAYQWCVETAVYTAPAARRVGVGGALYCALLRALPLQGFVNAYAGIALPNPASVALHEQIGFTSIGVYRQTGYKLGSWHDVGWWQRALQDRAAPRSAPLPFPAIEASDGYAECLSSAAARLQL